MALTLAKGKELSEKKYSSGIYLRSGVGLGCRTTIKFLCTLFYSLFIFNRFFCSNLFYLWNTLKNISDFKVKNLVIFILKYFWFNLQTYFKKRFKSIYLHKSQNWNLKRNLKFIIFCFDYIYYVLTVLIFYSVLKIAL